MASSSSSKFHPALAVTHIKNFIPITLALDTAEYSSWAELFKITARAYQVLDHILPSTTPSTSSTATSSLTLEQQLEREAAAAEAKLLWERLDAVVLQWIYGTISHDLLHTIIAPDSTAASAWERLEDIFQDNKNSRAVYLEDQFSNTRLDQFPNIAAYCQALKILSDQLKNVDSPVKNDRLVLRLVRGLPAHYDTVASFIQQTVPLPPFSKARSMLLLEEARKNQQHGNMEAAMVHAGPPVPRPNPHAAPAPRPDNRAARPRGRNSTRGGRNRAPPRPDGNPPVFDTSPRPGQWPFPPWSYWPTAPWAPPPCPYPAMPWNGGPSTSRSSASILGPAPHQAHVGGPSTTPTDLTTAMQSMSLSQPDSNWYMDTGATSHMASSSGSPNGGAGSEV